MTPVERVEGPFGGVTLEVPSTPVEYPLRQDRPSPLNPDSKLSQKT